MATMTALPLLVIQPDELDPLGPLGDWLASAGMDPRIIRPYQNEWIEPDLADFHGVIVLGGHLCSHDGSEPSWLAAVRALLAKAVARRMPTLAICLGAQLLAQAAGGRVGANPEGPDFGARLVAKRSAAADDPLFAELPITPDVISWHRDVVLALPPSSVLLAASPNCEVEAFRVGECAWGVQFHPEATAETVRSWAEVDNEALADYDTDVLLRRVQDAAEDRAEVWRPFAETFAGIVRNPTLATRANYETATEILAAPITDPAQIRAILASQMESSRRPAAGAVPIELLAPRREGSVDPRPTGSAAHELTGHDLSEPDTPAQP